MTRRPALLVLLTALVMVAVAGCVGIPESGAVRTGPTANQNLDSDIALNDPRGPEPDGTPVEIVRGFLDAMQAVPLTTADAREFLTPAAQETWRPEAATIAYGDSTLSEGDPGLVTASLSDTSRLTANGEWLSGLSKGSSVTFDLTLVRENGQWRISNPPSALVVPRETYFETIFEEYVLYFFDKSGQVLVPEPIYLPSGDQAATLLVEGLLRGPSTRAMGSVRTFIPPSTKVDLSVPIDEDGVAEVPLSDEVLELGATDLRMLSVQLLWTLRQVPEVRAVRITSGGGVPVNIPGQGTEVSTDAWSEFDPALPWASDELFGIRGGRVVAVSEGVEAPVTGPFGTAIIGVRGIAVDLSGEQVAGVSLDGRRLIVGPRAETEDDTGVTVVESGRTNLLRPSWDLYGQVWIVDRTPNGADLAVSRSGEVTEYVVPGLTGRTVKAFELCRDGTRLAAVVGGPDGDVVKMARIMRREDGTVRRLSRASEVSVRNLDPTQIRDLAWASPQSLVLLTDPAEDLSQVFVTRIDGSWLVTEAGATPEVFRTGANRIVASPARGAPVYVGTTGGQLFEQAPNGRWTGASVDTGLRSPTFVG